MAEKKLLVADDSLTIQKVIRLALSNEGYEIQTVSDGNDAVQQIPVFQPQIVLIDVSLPKKTAFEVKKEINQLGELSKVKFILMSSAFEKVDEEQISHHVFHGRLTKPFDPAHLRKVLAQVFSQQELAGLQAQSTPAQAPKPPIAPAAAPLASSSSKLPPPLPELRKTVSPPSMPARQQSEASAPNPVISPPLAQPTQSASGPPPLMPHVAPQIATEVQPPIQKEPDRWAGEEQPPFDEADIHHLTASTMEFNESNDFDWNVKEPSLKPSTQMLDLEGSNLHLGNQDQPVLQQSSPPVYELKETQLPGPIVLGENTRSTIVAPPLSSSHTPYSYHQEPASSLHPPLDFHHESNAASREEWKVEEIQNVSPKMREPVEQTGSTIAAPALKKLETETEVKQPEPFPAPKPPSSSSQAQPQELRQQTPPPFVKKTQINLEKPRPEEPPHFEPTNSATVIEEPDFSKSAVRGGTHTPPPFEFSPPPPVETIIASAPPPVVNLQLTPSAPTLAAPTEKGPNKEEVEKMIREEVQKALQKMTQNLLPDLAEKIIKEEIFKILSEG